MKKVIKYATREEWLKARFNGIGASEVASVLGINRWETPYKLWRRKMGLDEAVEENFLMKAGHYLEDAVSKFFADATGAYIIKNSMEDFTITDTEKPFLRVSPDRLYWNKGDKHNDATKCVLECKTTQTEVDPDNIPKHWFCQLQMNLGVGKYAQGALAWLTSGRKFDYLIVNFDPEFYQWMINKVADFWNINIKGNVPPEATQPTDVISMYPRHTEGATATADDNLREEIIRLKNLKEDKATLETICKEVEDKVKMAMGEAEMLLSPLGDTLATWKAPKPSLKFDEKKFAVDHPEMYNTYCKTYQPTRRLLIK